MGRSQPIKQVPDSPGSETSSGIVRTSSGHFRAFPGIFGYEMIIAYRIVRRRIACDRACRVRYRPSPDRMPLGPSRREWPVAGHGVAKGRRVRDDPSPDRVPSGASRAVWPVARSRAVGSVAGSRLVMCRRVRRRIACRMARRRIASRHVSAHPSDRTSLPCSWSGEPNARHLPIPGPTWPVADAATGGLRTFILLHRRGDL